MKAGGNKKRCIEKILRVVSFPKKGGYVPSIRVAGKWLKRFNFALGDRVTLVATEGKILITKKEVSDNGNSMA